MNTADNLITQFDDLRRVVNDLKTTHPNELDRIQTALDDLFHAEILIDNVLM